MSSMSRQALDQRACHRLQPRTVIRRAAMLLVLGFALGACTAEPTFTLGEFAAGPVIFVGHEFAKVFPFGAWRHTRLRSAGLRPGALFGLASRRSGDRRSEDYTFATNCLSTYGRIPPCW